MDLNFKIKENILNHEIIKNIISTKKLNIKQIESAFHIFLKIIDEHKNDKKLDYFTDVEIYDEETVVEISVPTKEFLNNYKRNKNHILSNITFLDSSIKFANPRKKYLKFDKEHFYFEINNFENVNDRSKLAEWTQNFYTQQKLKKYSKGIFLFGQFGLGKSFFLKAFSNWLIEKEKNVVFLNSNDLYDQMTKNLDRNNDQNSHIVNLMKNVDFLIIDDIGSEKPNNWFLFSIIYPILDFRLKERKTTSFSSIFSISGLKKYWQKSKELDVIKIDRTIDKIKSLTNEIEIKGKDLRDFFEN